MRFKKLVSVFVAATLAFVSSASFVAPAMAVPTNNYNLSTGAGPVIDVRAYGAVGNGVADDTAAIQAALNTGKSVLIPSGMNCAASALTMTNASQSLFGTGPTSILTSSNPALNLITVSADNVSISDLRINGTATSDANSKFAVFTATASPANNLRVVNVLFSGASAGVGLNSGIKYDSGCNYGYVGNCSFERLWGNVSGTGYGVLSGAVTGLNIISNKWIGAAGRGRHGFYLSAGATNCKVSSNFVALADYEGITLNSQGVQPANAHNIIAFNTVKDCCVFIGVLTGAISIFGHADGNRIQGNSIVNSKGCGIKLDGTAYTDLLNTSIIDNTIASSDYIGIDLLSAVGGTLSGNSIVESSLVAAGTHPNIRLKSDGTTATSNWLVTNNLSSGITYSRSAFQLDVTAPTPSDLKVFANKFNTCYTTDIELNSIVCAIDAQTPTRVDASVAITVGVNDYEVLCNYAGLETVAIAGLPTLGRRVVIKDMRGDATTYPIVVDPDNGNIDGSATKSIIGDYGAMVLVGNGTNWSRR